MCGEGIYYKRESVGVSPGQKQEPDSGHESLGTPPGAPVDSVRCFVRITSYRLHECDEHNLWEHYLVDCLKEAGIIVDDSPTWCIVQKRQVIVKCPESEATYVEISWPHPTSP